MIAKREGLSHFFSSAPWTGRFPVPTTPGPRTISLESLHVVVYVSSRFRNVGRGGRYF